MKSKQVVYAAIIAALYIILTYAVAPLSYGPIQLRVSNLLKPLALQSPFFALGYGIGTFIGNLGSPFGVWDIFIMPIVDIAAAYIAWIMRRFPYIALGVQATIISVSVSLFPLQMGGGIPFIVTFPGVLLSNALVIYFGYILIWRKVQIGVRA